MTEKMARQLAKDYVEGWKNADIGLICRPLAGDCIVVESHGPTYRSVEQVKKWAEEWYRNAKVDEWRIGAFYFVKDTAFFEWSFACTVHGRAEFIDGASLVRFMADKINYIHEYRMTKPAFDHFA